MLRLHQFYLPLQGLALTTSLLALAALKAASKEIGKIAVEKVVNSDFLLPFEVGLFIINISDKILSTSNFSISEFCDLVSKQRPKIKIKKN